MVTYSIGRGRANDIVVEDSSVSRRHAELRVSPAVDKDGFVLVDLGSTNGTCVRDDGRWIEIEKASIESDERVLLGEVVTTVSALLERRKPPSRKLAVRHMADASERTAPGGPLSGRLSALRRLTGERSDHARIIGRPRRGKVDAASFVSPRIEPDPPSRRPVPRQGISARLSAASPAATAAQPPRLIPPPVAPPALPRSNTHVPTSRPPPSRSNPLTGSVAKWSAVSAIALLVVAAVTLILVRYGNALIGTTATQQIASAPAARASSVSAKSVDARPPPVETDTRRFLGGPGDDTLAAATRYRDGSVVLVGSTTGETAAKKTPGIWVVRLDSTGKLLWRRRHATGSGDHGLSVAGTTDGGSFVAGTTRDRSVAWIMRVDANGERVWAQRIAVGKRSAAISVAPASDHGVTALIVSRDAKTSRTQSLLARFDSSGNIRWRKKLGKGSVWATDIRRMRDGGWAIAGIRRAKSRRPALWVARADENGRIRWSRTLATAGRDVRAYVRIARRGDLIAAATHRPAGSNTEPTYRLVRLTRDGKKKWDYIGRRASGVRVTGMYLVKRAIILAGVSRLATPHATSPWLARIGVDGNADWQRRFDELAPARFAAILGRAGNGFLVAGTISRGAQRRTDGLLAFLNPRGRPGL